MTHKIRHRTRRLASPPAGMKQEWSEWQITHGRKVISRHDTEQQAREALAIKKEPRQITGLDAQDRNTILAALRYYQDHDQGEPSSRSDWIHALATDNDQEISLDSAGIDELCERLNLS